MNIRRQVVTAALLFATLPAFGDGTLISWSPRDLQGASQASFDAAKAQTTDAILEKNKSVTTWPEAYHLLVGANERRSDKRLLAGLAAQITDRTRARLSETGRLIIWEHITAGEIVFEGKGLQVSDDLFTVGGRANWMLRTITGENFGYVKPRTDAAELRALQDRWMRRLKGERVPPYEDPYATTVTGLEEIRSPEALEALIVSLRPNPAKDAMTSKCLRQLYGLDSLPADPTSQARLCSPDTYTHRYLAVLTQIQEPHDSEWWEKWWKDRRASLKWSAETGSFTSAP